MQAAVAGAATRDSDIVQLLEKGHRDRAFALLLPRYEGKIYRLCCALLRDRIQAEDLAQETLVRVWRALANYDGRASLSSWIYAITRNRCLTALTRKSATVPATESELETGIEALAATGRRLPQAESDELRAMVDRLPERLRRALLLYYYEERSVAEVALMLGCPEGTVKTYLHRGRAALARELERRGLADPRHWLEDAS
ncbi:MAG TPA: RNA polymerase sigma factor [Steroidobacteraceae bacterium]|nr:RNA polymerase sigma factor [Steroidobacteraceae bacterium]